MPRFVALLRGVNVGKTGRRVPMGDLRELLAALGYRDVRTLMNSGNAVFSGAASPVQAHAARIGEVIAESLKVEVAVIVKSARDIAAIESENSLATVATDPRRLLVAFTARGQDLRGLAALGSWVTPPEQFVLGRHAAYLWCPRGFLECHAARALLGPAGRAATSRNWATVQKIAACLRGGAGKPE
ncbi:MAG TPA: DUF1697 domain-containing protein [Burkholderiaceae bacterium]|nr:DUF1697 domain-containing protein [Burkholderiaceae bacterium]